MTRSDSFALELIDTVVLTIVSIITGSACILILVFGLPQPEELVKDHMIAMADVSRNTRIQYIACAHRHQHHQHH